MLRAVAWEMFDPPRFFELKRPGVRGRGLVGVGNHEKAAEFYGKLLGTEVKAVPLEKEVDGDED